MVEKSVNSFAPGPLLWVGIAAMLQIGLLWGTALPLGVPEEWTWARTTFSAFDWFGIWPLILAGGVLCWFVKFSSDRIATASRRARVISLLALWMLGTVWLLSLVSSVPGIAGLSRAPFVLYYARASGYFTQARENVGDLSQFLSTYHVRIQDSENPENYLHMGTHPPGLTMGFALLIELCEKSPGLREAILATQPNSIRDAFDVIFQNQPSRDPLSQHVDIAVLWLATLMTAVMAAGTCIPLYLLARRAFSVDAAWWTTSMWLLVPALGVFLPKSDIVFPFLVMWSQWLWLEGIDRRSLWCGLAAGTVLFLSVCLSLAFAPIGLILVLQWFFIPADLKSEFKNQETPIKVLKSRLPVPTGACGAFAILLLTCWGAGGINLLAVWIQNLQNHAAFYSHFTRSYPPWFLVNPIELGCAVGLPLALLSLSGVWVLLRSKVPFRREMLIPILVWGFLWISGKNMGEAARLWIFLMPYAVWIAGVNIERMCRVHQGKVWLMGCFLLQLSVCAMTVLRIDGFHFAELMP